MAEKSTIKLDNLHFDQLNPRLPKALIGCTDESKILDYMVRYGNIVELMQSIGETGYSEAEPLLVVPKINDPNSFVVVEGNRRLAALKLLSHPELTTLRKNIITEVIQTSKNIPQDIPVILYSNREDILDYLGYRHITGVKDWGALEKARYLDQLYDQHIQGIGEEQIYTVLAKMIGSRSDYVSKLHTALKLYDLANDNAYYGAQIEEEDFNFSWLTTALSFSNTVNYLGLKSAADSTLSNLDNDHYSQLFIWLFDPKKRKVEDSRQIADLNKILEAPSALKKLEQGNTISEAILYTSAPNETFIELIDKAKVNLQNSKNMIEQLSNYPDEAIATLEDIEKLCKSVKGALLENFQKTSTATANFGDFTPEQMDKLKQLLNE